MSVDTRTPRMPTGGSPAGSYDSQSVLSAVKVPSDPAQVIVNNVSFRVRLATPGSKGRPTPGSNPPRGAAGSPRARRFISAARPPASLTSPPRATGSAGDFGPAPRARPSTSSAQPHDLAAGSSAPSAGIPAARTARRRAPVVWSGRAMPGDASASQLLSAVPQSTSSPLTATGPGTSGERPAEETHSTTRVLPRLGPGTDDSPTVVMPRVPQPSAPRDGAIGRHPAAPDLSPGSPAEPGAAYEATRELRVPLPAERDRSHRREARSQDEARQAYFPDRRMNLGIVLLPLRIFLGFISLYAGMGKLTDPVYFDGGERGSMVTWLRGLEPWAIASPLHDFAVAHPVGAGLTVAFGQVIVGVLTIFGLWQRAAAALGALLSIALLVTVSWNNVAAYDAPDIIYLAAWSPLVIAGAPVYSLDARLAGEAWRTLGPRSRVVDLRRRVLRRGALLVTLLVGLALLVGSILGSAVRSAQVATVPEPGDTPRNHLPGSPLPKDPRTSGPQSREPSAGPTAGQSAGPTQRPSTEAEQQAPAGETGAPGEPSQNQTVQAPQQTPQQPQAPAPTTGGGEQSDGDGGSSDGGGTPDDDPEDDESPGRGALGGLLG